MKQHKRCLSPREKNHLLKYGISLSQLDLKEIGQMPVEYLTGFAEFKNLNLKVNQSVLIPRIETEQLVELVIGDIKNDNKKGVILADVGCGSGAIGLAILKEFRTSKVIDKCIFSDVSEEAVKISQYNFKKNFRVSKDDFNCFFLISDLLKSYNSIEKFDYIVANLPYIPTPYMVNLPSSVVDYEPLVALDGGKTGLKLINRLLKATQKYLKSGGKVFLEIDHRCDIAELPQIFDYQFINDQFDRRRFVICDKNYLVL